MGILKKTFLKLGVVLTVWGLRGIVEAIDSGKPTIRSRLAIRILNRRASKMLEVKGSWRTSLGAVGLLLSTIAYIITQISDGKPETNVDFTIVMAGISGAWAAWKARDNKVSSEMVGAGQIPPK